MKRNIMANGPQFFGSKDQNRLSNQNNVRKKYIIIVSDSIIDLAYSIRSSG